VRSSTHEIADEIRRYCASRPDARDTIDGIVWWVRMQRQEDFRNGVVAAVQLLVKEGVLEEFQLQDGTVVFGCGRAVRSDSPG
jgi:hypothetical protein